MTDRPSDIHAADTEAVIADVWSRTESKYRRRAFILLTINVLLFAGLGCVAYWLRTGVVFAPAADGYWAQIAETFQPTADTRFTPTALSLAPININDVPMMIPVLGLILAALVSIPVLVAILYRFPAALPFIGVVGFIAVMPWLAVTLLGSCILASVKPFRFRSRFASALMSLLPVMVYFFMASRQNPGAVDALTNPADRVKLLAPLILALIASGIVMGVVLNIAKLVNYRPGAIAPLLAVLFLTPAALFEFQVGRDELHYRLLEGQFGPGSEYFAILAAERVFEGAVETASLRSQNAGKPRNIVRDQVEFEWSLALDAEAGLLFTRYQDRAAHAADWFVSRFPDSVYACNALYLKGRALDMRVDLQPFRQSRKIVFYDDFPAERSRGAWELIEANRSSSPTVAAALLRLAILDARQGRVESATKRLQRLVHEFGFSSDRVTESAEAGLVGEFMQRKPPENSLIIPLERTLLEGRKLLDLLVHNRDPLYGAQPLIGLMNCDPKHPLYAENLRGVVKRFPDGQLRDNIELRIALVEPDIDARIVALKVCAARPEPADSVPEALYQLGVAYQENKDPERARTAFERVLHEHETSMWVESTRARLRRLDRAAGEIE